MPTFKHTVNVSEQHRLQAALGASSSTPLTNSDVNKLVKLEAASADNNYVVGATGEDIEGLLVGVEAHTVNGGFGFGTVQDNGRMEAEVDAAELGTLAVGDFVVAADQAAVGTAQDYPLVILGAGSVFKWRAIRIISGDGTAGSIVLLERVS